MQLEFSHLFNVYFKQFIVRVSFIFCGQITMNVHYSIGKWMTSLVWREAVVCADTVDTFKNRLDKFWQDQVVLYNFIADICTRSWSQVSAILD